MAALAIANNPTVAGSLSWEGALARDDSSTQLDMGACPSNRPIKLASHRIVWVAALAIANNPTVAGSLSWEGALARDDSSTQLDMGACPSNRPIKLASHRIV
ncbi:hypothetical protein GCM10007157_26760 [Vreelandella hamiltonii]|uniref:Uncharacterized protein n=1 Tax=Vreelandella hamiltonii TaxID=502829 RepID=A0A8H9I4S9_9GAMM|nr:hypothetical protein GCM10007157_26760 [Halomonas hamiltonii]